MRKFLFLIPLLSHIAYTAPRNLNPKNADEIWRNDLDLTDDIKKTSGQVDSLTLAQIRTTTPKRKGKSYFCTDCATAAICTSTGTLVGQFSNISAKTTACQ